MEAKTLTIAAYQGNCFPGDVQANLKIMKKQMEIASKADACLIVFPELYTTGYFLEPDEMRRLAEPKNGPIFQQLSQWSKELNIGVVYGYPELDNTNGSPIYYNSAMFINSEGCELGNYRKQHLWVTHEPDIFKHGIGNLIVTYNGIKIGVLICFDVEFPESVRCLALEGAQIVVVPTALTVGDWSRISDVLIPSRALENNIFVAYINSSSLQNGRRFLGHSCIYGPDGKPVIVAGEQETMLLATIDIKKCEQQQKLSCYFSERRPELYNKIVSK